MIYRRIVIAFAFCALPARLPAAPIVHVKYPVYGCAKADAVAGINNDADPRQKDPDWLASAMGYGQCVRITPQSPWEPVGPDQNGLTLLAYRGTIGQPGSFYVPTPAIDFPAGSLPGPVAPPIASPPPGASPPAGTSAPAGAQPQPDSAQAPAANPQLADVEAGMAQVQPADQTAPFPVFGVLITILAAGAAGAAIWLRRAAARRTRLMAAIRQEIAGNARALQAKRAQTVHADEYGTPDWTQWHAAKAYYLNTRIAPILAEHGFQRVPPRCEGEVDALIEEASAGQAA